MGMRRTAILALGAVTCVLAGFLAGRMTAPEAERPKVADTGAVEVASRGWPTVWPGGGWRSAPELDALLDPQLTAVSGHISRDLRLRAERIRAARVLVRRSQVRPRIDLPALDLRRLHFRYLGDAIADPELRGFSMRHSLKWSVKRPWRTSFGAYFHHGDVHELRHGRWALRKASPWDTLAPAWPLSGAGSR